jgi:hypothetical protein
MIIDPEDVFFLGEVIIIFLIAVVFMDFGLGTVVVGTICILL